MSPKIASYVLYIMMANKTIKKELDLKDNHPNDVIDVTRMCRHLLHIARLVYINIRFVDNGMTFNE